jgi:hypothetical protein
MRPGVVEGEGIWIWGFDSDSRTFTSSAPGGELFCRGVQLIPLHKQGQFHSFIHSFIQFTMLHLVGLGLADEKDITVRGLEIVKKAERVYLEAYTAILLVDKAKLVSGFFVFFQLLLLWQSMCSYLCANC